MTCILIVKKSPKKCMSASDRRLSLSGTEFTQDANPKVKKIAGMLVGGAGEASPIDLFFLMTTVLQDFKSAIDPYAYLLTVVIPSWHKFLVDSHILPEDGPITDGPESDLFIASKGRCFSISLSANGTINAIENTLPCAFGCGGSLALAALKGIEYADSFDEPLSLKHRLEKALEIVATLNLACDNNIDILSE